MTEDPGYVKVTITIETSKGIEVIEIPRAEQVLRSYLYDGSMTNNMLRAVQFKISPIHRPAPGVPEYTSTFTAKEN